MYAGVTHYHNSEYGEGMGVVHIDNLWCTRSWHRLKDCHYNYEAYIIDIWEERKSKLYGDVACAQQPRPHSPTGDLGKIAGVNGQNSEGMCQGGKPGTGKLYTNVCLCCSAHTSGCVVDGLGATAAF